MHIKACLATGYKPRAWRQEKMMFIPAITGETLEGPVVKGHHRRAIHPIAVKPG
jgi:hypothetical protein